MNDKDLEDASERSAHSKKTLQSLFSRKSSEGRGGGSSATKQRLSLGAVARSLIVDKTKLDSKSGLPSTGLTSSGLPPSDGLKRPVPRLSDGNIDLEAQERIR
jgi:hypothetical protein